MLNSKKDMVRLEVWAHKHLIKGYTIRLKQEGARTYTFIANNDFEQVRYAVIVCDRAFKHVITTPLT